MYYYILLSFGNYISLFETKPSAASASMKARAQLLDSIQTSPTTAGIIPASALDCAGSEGIPTSLVGGQRRY